MREINYVWEIWRERESKRASSGMIRISFPFVNLLQLFRQGLYLQNQWRRGITCSSDSVFVLVSINFLYVGSSGRKLDVVKMCLKMWKTCSRCQVFRLIVFSFFWHDMFRPIALKLRLSATEKSFCVRVCVLRLRGTHWLLIIFFASFFFF